ncbi:MAG: M23 family metallopeptidase [Gemmatimonadota bacterium]|nr:M23 family metallopeptidase [Gemmatimonadota bacterium]
MRKLSLALLLAVAPAACAPVYSRVEIGSERTEAPPAASSRPERAAAADVEPGGAHGSDAALVRVLESLVWPLARARIVETSPYGNRLHPRGRGSRFHSGVDLRAEAGSPVHAVADGVVVRSGRSGAYGRVVVLDHGARLQSLYAHHSRNLVRVGERVRRGQPIALAGHTGNATGVHLHFELRWRGGFVDPRSVLPSLEPPTGR